MKRDPVLAPAVVLVWGAVALFVLYPLGRLLVLTFWNGGPSLDAVRGLVGDWTHRVALVNSLLLAALVGVAGTALGLAFALLAVRANLPRWVGRDVNSRPVPECAAHGQARSLVPCAMARLRIAQQRAQAGETAIWRSASVGPLSVFPAKAHPALRRASEG